MRRTFLALVAAVTTTILFATIGPAQSKSLKVALVLPGPIDDGTFNSAAHKGIKGAEKKYNIKVSIRENTKFAEMEAVMRNYVEDKYDVIIAHGFQFGDPAKKLHKQFPKTWFVVNTSRVSAGPNLASFDNRWKDAGFVAGAIAALVTKSGVIGHVGGIPIPVIKAYNEGFKLGAESVNSKVKMLSAYVGSFSDVAKAKEITKSLIERSADVLTATGNESVMGTIQAAKEAKVLYVGNTFDAAALAPDTIVTTVVMKFETNISMAIDKIMKGDLMPRNYLLGFSDGGIELAPYRKFADKLSAEDKSRIQKLIADIKAGKIKVLENNAK